MAMNNFLIGMHGKFDAHKYDRDFRNGFYGVEACMFPNEQEVDELVKKAKEDGFSFGVHYPLLKKDTPYRDPFLFVEYQSCNECVRRSLPCIARA